MKNKGFTLIELLAVIVILAIIAVIAVPKILNVVEEAKKSSAEASALGYIDAVEKYVLLNNTDNSNYPYDLKGKTLDIISTNGDIPGVNTFLKIKGDKPTRGTITINEKGKVTYALFGIKGYSVTCQNDRCTVTGTSSSLSSISIKTMPTKTIYANASELLDLTGLEVEATYADGTKTIVDSNDIVTSQANNTALTTVGTNPITVSYTSNGTTKTTSFNVKLEKMAIAYNSLSTFDYKGYNGNLNDYTYTTRLNTANPLDVRVMPYIILPENILGKKLNVVCALDQQYSWLYFGFGDENGNLIDYYHVYAAVGTGATKGHSENNGRIEDIIYDYNVHTFTMDIPPNAKYLGIYRYNTEHGSKMYDMYVTAE